VIDALELVLNEFREEAAVTRRVMERVPADKLSWRPHPRSMSLGQLALHVARIPGSLARFVQTEVFAASEVSSATLIPGDVSEIHAAFEQSVRSAEECLSGMSDLMVSGNGCLTLRGKEVSARPWMRALRFMVLNPWYHHRGQLSVYFRLLEVPVPLIYGHSADECPFT